MKSRRLKTESIKLAFQMKPTFMVIENQSDIISFGGFGFRIYLLPRLTLGKTLRNGVQAVEITV